MGFHIFRFHEQVYKTEPMVEIRDLADPHSLLSDIFKIPVSSDEWEKYRLIEDQVANFREYGYFNCHATP